LEALIAARMGWDPARVYVVTGQTYPRLLDAQVVNSLAVIAAAIQKCAGDLRLLAHMKEVEEPFEASQIGSSAMPYKRNPMRCERATGLARFVISAAANPLNTAATQWLERTLDDSSNRRIVLPETFLALDAALDIMLNVTGGLVVNERTILRNISAELPFLETESLLMAAVRNGHDRQDVHERIREHSMAAARRVKEEGLDNDLIRRLQLDETFAGVDFDKAMSPEGFIGLAPQQVDRFVAEVVAPIRARYAGHFGVATTLRV
jgi:adenylosuccinate lyase